MVFTGTCCMRFIVVLAQNIFGVRPTHKRACEFHRQCLLALSRADKTYILTDI